jgi:hypothetical protein
MEGEVQITAVGPGRVPETLQKPADYLSRKSLVLLEGNLHTKD